MEWWHFIILVMRVLFFIKGVYFVLFIPPWEAPDEMGHAAYVSYLYINRSIPDNVTKKPIIDRSMGTSWGQQQQLLKQMQKGNITNKKELYDRNGYVMMINKGTIAPNPPLYYLYLLPFYILSLL